MSGRGTKPAPGAPQMVPRGPHHAHQEDGACRLQPRPLGRSASFPSSTPPPSLHFSLAFPMSSCHAARPRRRSSFIPTGTGTSSRLPSAGFVTSWEAVRVAGLLSLQAPLRILPHAGLCKSSPVRPPGPIIFHNEDLLPIKMVQVPTYLTIFVAWINFWVRPFLVVKCKGQWAVWVAFQMDCKELATRSTLSKQGLWSCAGQQKEVTGPPFEPYPPFSPLRFNLATFSRTR